MTRSWLVLVLALGACNTNKTETTKPGSGSGVGSGSGPGVVAIDADDPVMAVIAKAFGGAPPVLPQLSRDGITAAYALVTPVGMTGASSYSIGFTGANGDAWSGGPELLTLIDSQVVQLLLDAQDGETQPIFDTRALDAAVTEIRGRLDNGHFTPFEHAQALDDAGAGDITAGPFALHATETPAHVLEVAIAHDGKPVGSQKLEPIATGMVGGNDCTAHARLHGVWFDTARSRLLLQVRWRPDSDHCLRPDDRFILVGP